MKTSTLVTPEKALDPAKTVDNHRLKNSRLPAGLLVGNRIPQNYFETGGKGESNNSIHAGSFHLALKNAGIEMCNIMTYSSILPGIATKVEKPSYIEHGCVMESIMSAINARKGEIATAGIIYGWLYDKKNRSRYGGLVCEHNGNYGPEKLQELLNASLKELYLTGFSENYNLGDTHILKESFIPKKEFGTALVGLCFTSYYYPLIRY